MMWLNCTNQASSDADEQNNLVTGGEHQTKSSKDCGIEGMPGKMDKRDVNSNNNFIAHVTRKIQAMNKMPSKLEACIK